MKSHDNDVMKQMMNKTYDDLVKEWLAEKEDARKQVKTDAIQLWDKSDVYTVRENKGKTITDNNPYVDLVDPAYFDLVIENEPFPVAPPPMIKTKDGQQKPSKTSAMIKVSHKEVTGSSDTYTKAQEAANKRMSRETMGIEVPEVSKHVEKDLNKVKSEVEAYAKSLGFACVGVTKVDMRYVAGGSESEIIFDTIILLGYEMPISVIEKYPNPENELAAFGAYTGCANNVHKVADFIRSKGYDCRSKGWGGAIKYPPHAVNAGIGNYSTHGICVSPEVGTRVKYCAILVDAELPLDQPKDFNIEEFCSRCRMCQKTCPGGTISKEKVFHKGAMKRVSRYMRCAEQMATNKECLKCIRVCPFSMIGYDRCMESLPAYYGYNTMNQETNLEGNE